MPRLSLRGIRKAFGATKVLQDVSLDVEAGEFVSLVGASGCGKSTLLRIIAGLEAPDAGEVRIDGRAVDHLVPKLRDVAMVFQDYALYPHMTVAQNIATPLVMARVPLGARLPLLRHGAPAARRARAGIEADVTAVAKRLRIEHLLDRKPAQLSGGQRQRVALGRALVRNPRVFLMDEPLSNLDAKLRVQVRAEISELHQSSGLTFVYVTHDQLEAMTMSDRIAMMHGGRLLQVASPGELYSDPVDLDVARFIGSPEINLVPARVSNGRLHALGSTWPLRILSREGEATVGLRPEALTIVGCSDAAPEDRRARDAGCEIEARSRLVEDLGHELLIHAEPDRAPGLELRVRTAKAPHGRARMSLRAGDRLRLRVDPGAALVFDGEGTRLASHLVSVPDVEGVA